ncbi:hypothetical protein ACS0TY_029459 [Phlomoides rotata]
MVRRAKAREKPASVDSNVKNPRSWVVREKADGEGFITLVIHYGGSFVSKPIANYIGGSLLVLDYVRLGRDTTCSNLNNWTGGLGIIGERRYYAILRNGFKYLSEDIAFTMECFRCEEFGKIDVYIEGSLDRADGGDEGREQEGGRDDMQVGAEGREQEGGRDDMQVWAEGREHEGGRDDMQVWAEGREQGVEQMVEEDDIEDDDKLYETYVDQEIMEKGDESSGDESSGDSDVACDGDRLDEMRISDNDEHDSPIVFNPDIIFNPSFELGMIFGSKDEFRKVVQSHAIQSRRTLHFPKNDKIRIYARCRGDGCDWGINLVKIKDQATFHIRLYNLSHKCPPIFKVKNVKSSWLGEKFTPDFQNEPKRKVDGWRKRIMKELNVNSSRQQAYRAKIKALEIIVGKPDEQYSKLWDYAQELRTSNPKSTIVLDNDDEGIFRGMYVCFQAVRIGFNSGCRPFIGVDGCWLKGPHGGILLSAVGVDPGNSIFPLAYAVVSKENKDTWGWFLRLLKSDLNIGRPSAYTIMSDKQKGLIIAVNEVFPGAEHRFCVRHLHNNFQKTGFRGLAFKNLLWKAARATTVGKFNLAMEEMREMDSSAANWFSNKPPNEWSKSHFSEHSKSDMLLNNVCECFNAAILDARDKPVITMFEWLRQWLMTRLQIECFDGSQFAIDLEGRKCSCRSWGLSGIPCKHAISAIVDMGLDPEDFVHTCYSLDTYKRVYEHPILPISGQLEWAKTLYIPPMPPSFLRKIGRPATARRVEPEEKSRKKDKVDKLRRRGAPKLSCTKCGRVGHNTSTCKEEAGQTSQPINVQEPAPEGMADYIPEPLNVGGEQSEVNDVSEISPESILNNMPKKVGVKRGRPPKKKNTTERTTASHQEEMRVETEDDQAFEELLTEALISTEALLSQSNSASQFQNLGMPSVPTTVGPTPFQQLHNLDSTPRMLSGPNIRAPPPFVNGGMRPQFSTQSHYESRNKRIIVDGGTKYLDLSQESLQ